MLDQAQTQEQDLSNDFNNPPEKTYDLFGQLVDLETFKGAYQKGTRGAVPFDPNVHQKAQSIIRFYIQPLPEINVTYLDQLNYESTNWADWAKVTWPSLKDLGFVDYHEIKDRWFRFSRVPNGKTYTKSDGSTGEEKTWKMVVVFANEDECRKAYVAAGGKSDFANGNGHNATAVEESTDKKNARVFLEAIIKNVSHGKTTFAEVQEAVKAHTAYKADTAPYIARHYPIDSIETMTLITEITKLMPF